MENIRFFKTSILLLIFISFAASAQKAEFKNQTVELDGKQVNVSTAIPETRTQNLPVVVFQSGMGTPLNNWNSVALEVEKFAPVFVYDRPGIGRSEMLDVSPTPEVIAEHLDKLLNHMNIQPPYILVGHSWGGPLINSFAVKYPSKVAGMVFVDESDIINARKYEAKVDKEFKISEETKKKWEEASNMDNENLPPGLKAEREVSENLYELTEEDFDPKRFTPDIKVPTAYLVGAKLDDLPPDSPEDDLDIAKVFEYLTTLRMNDFMDKIRNNTEATLIVATHAAHYIHRDDPALVVEAIKRVTYPKIENQLIAAFEANGDKGMVERYHQMKSYYPEDDFNESLLNSLGYSLMRSGKMDEAVAVFKLNTKEYPDEANPYDSLGDAYAAMDNFKEAENLYKKASEHAKQQDHPNEEIYRSKYEKMKTQKKN